MYLGEETFLKRVQAMLWERERSGEHVEAQRVVRCASVEQVERVLAEVSAESAHGLSRRALRLAFALLARDEALMKLGELGDILGVGATGASYLARQATELARRDEGFAVVVEEVRLRIRNCILQM